MARITKANAVKSKAKAKSLKEESAKSAINEKRAQIRVVASQKTSSTKAKETSKTEAIATAPSTEKKVSQRLIETIEKRRQAKGGAVGRVPGRRGRRPKALAEYVPSTNEEENASSEPEFEGLEYDTGIRVKEGKDDYGFSMDRFEDYDEELNFDW